jgi:hypothetical protein
MEYGTGIFGLEATATFLLNLFLFFLPFMLVAMK